MGGCVNPASQLPLATGASSRNLWPAFECSFVCSYLVLKRHQSVPRKGPTPSVPIFLSCGGAVVACDSVYRITEANDMSLLIWPRAPPPPLRNFVRLTRRWPRESERERERETRFTAVISIYHLKDPPSDNARVKPQSSRARGSRGRPTTTSRVRG